MNTTKTIKLNGLTLFKQAKSPYYTLRVMVRGKRRQFSTGESTKATASDKAKVILADLKSRGLEEAIALHSRRADRLPADPSLDELMELYRSVMRTTESPPSRQTQERYIKSLNFIAKWLAITRARSLRPDKIRTFIGDYQADALAMGRDPNSVKVTTNFILRNAAAMFSATALAGYADAGLILENPFVGLKLKRVEIQGFTPIKPEILQSIWRKAALLRDGDPDAPAPVKPESEACVKGGRWTEPDWRKPHPEAYLLLLLELGLGLRRHESEKAEWDWIFCDTEGRSFLEVKPTPYFTPKSKERRVIPLAKSLHEALLAFHNGGRFIVPGREPKALSEYPAGKQPRNLVYRCDVHHRTLARWLRMRGVSDGKPCHLLRKQFGSYVATAFGLFHAQKFLGHSSPQITSDYYAGLVGLPEISHHQIIGPKGEPK